MPRLATVARHLATDGCRPHVRDSGIVLSVSTLAAALPRVGSAFLMPYLVERFHSWQAPLLVRCEYAHDDDDVRSSSSSSSSFESRAQTTCGLNALAALIWALCSTARRADVDLDASHRSESRR